jgi:uncharacterized protein (DUF2062 family)
MKKKIVEKIKNFVKQFFLIDDTPFKIALGASLGVFFGIVPGEGVLTTIAVCYLFRANRLAGTFGVLSTNMWTTFVVLPLAAFFGAMIFGTDSQTLIEGFNHHGGQGISYYFSKLVFFNFAFPLLAGFAIVSFIIALLVFLLILGSLMIYGKRHGQKISA